MFKWITVIFLIVIAFYVGKISAFDLGIPNEEIDEIEFLEQEPGLLSERLERIYEQGKRFQTQAQKKKYAGPAYTYFTHSAAFLNSINK